MFFKQSIKTFNSDQNGATTVDLIFLTAAIVGLGMVVMTTIGGGVEEKVPATTTAPSN